MQPHLATRKASHSLILSINNSDKFQLSSILRDIIGLYQDGLIKPLLSKKVIPAIHITEAFQYVSQQAGSSEHIVISWKGADRKSTIPSAIIESRRRNLVFDLAASFLLVGGLGSLGRSFVIWMAEHETRNSVFMSRSAGSKDEDRQFAKELSTMGCKPQLVAGDVCNVSDVKRPVDMCIAAGPLSGIIRGRVKRWAQVVLVERKGKSVPVGGTLGCGAAGY